MNKPLPEPIPASTEEAHVRWAAEYSAQIGADRAVHNRSGIPVRPLYTPLDVDPARFDADVGFPGQPPYTRGIYATMHRGRTWTQRQLIGLGTPAAYNARLTDILGQGGTAVSLIPCNSVFRGYDMDEVDEELLGTCGVVANSADHMATCLAGVDLATTSCAMNDPSPFTLLAFMLATAKRNGVDWRTISGTSNQSDYLSHYVANHMFFRLALPGARRILVDHIRWCNEHVPRWNPLSVVGQHTQQAGATPAESMAFTLAAAVQYADDCVAAGMSPDAFLPRFTFFFDVSISFFEEIAKFRAGRRIWARIARERWGARDPRSWRFKFHAQTSGVDLTRQQPLNNIARVTAQAIAGIFGGLQSLHTDAYDEALSCPTQFGARIAVATQNILREEAHLTDVIDPLGGSYYVEALTNEMEARVLAIMADVEAAGGMYRAVESGLVQRRIGESACRFQERIDRGEQTVVGVNAYQVDEDASARPALPKPDPAEMRAHLGAFTAWKAQRPAQAVAAALDGVARAANDGDANVFAAVVAAAEAGCTHGEICGTLRREVGFGMPLTVV
ncbi:MAG: acyl-CoA mutase large subunit family protein [Betaproteobacteria bacterium]|nr:acyl-CoA mutase large subunit family protein [Betaproteobacteria bacterium]